MATAASPAITCHLAPYSDIWTNGATIRGVTGYFRQMTADFQLTFPPITTLDWVLTALMGIIATSALAYFILPSPTNTTNRLVHLRNQFGLEKLPLLLFVLIVGLWFTLFSFIFIGMLWMITDAATHAWGSPTNSFLPAIWGQATNGLRGTLISLTAMTATLGAVVALPVTILRLQYNARQTEATEAALLNEKLNAAFEGLNARRTVTSCIDDTVITEQQDDIVTRAIAIDRLEGLVKEHPAEAPRIASILSLYVRELTTEHPAIWAPSSDPSEIREWVKELKSQRSDMEKAVQTLGRINTYVGVKCSEVVIDLRGANLQAYDLHGLHFSRAHFDNAALQGANFGGAKLKGASFESARLKGTSFYRANLQEANFQSADLKAASLVEANLRRAFLIKADLKWSDIEEADLRGARFRSADLRCAYLEGVEYDENTSFSRAKTEGASLKEVDCTTISFTDQQMKMAFGDASTIPRHRKPNPPHWPTFEMYWSEYHTELRKFRANPDSYTPPDPP